MIKFSKELYTKKGLLKASYSFTDRYYVHLSADSENYIVVLTAKNGQADIGEEEFKNELLAQEVREIVNVQTHDIRTLLMARAFSSSVIDNGIPDSAKKEDSFDLEDILTDWFDKNVQS